MQPPIAASDDSAQSSAKRVNNPANKALTNQTCATRQVRSVSAPVAPVGGARSALSVAVVDPWAGRDVAGLARGAAVLGFMGRVCCLGAELAEQSPVQTLAVSPGR